MKNKNKPARDRVCVLAQLCKLIPSHATSRIARDLGDAKRARSFTAWSHVVALLHAQLCHSISLADVCDSMALRTSRLSLLRGATAPARNTLSHANTKRNPKLMEQLFWETLRHLENASPRFGPKGRYSGVPKRFKRAIHAIDSSTIALVANCIDWAKHRRRKAAAKLHLRLDLQCFLPRFAIVEEASHHDNTRARELCADLKDGEIALFDKAYIDFLHLHDLAGRGVWWVTRAKDNMQFKGVRRGKADTSRGILRDDTIRLKGSKSREAFPGELRRVVAMVEIDGKKIKMVFITNNFKWAASSVCELYLARWGIEVFFKQLKQTLRLSGFIGYSKNAIQWQVWAALLVWLLARFRAFLSQWPHSFSRLMALLRSHAWELLHVGDLLEFHGTAGGLPRMVATPNQAYLPGLEPR
ncbi:MAG: IS4 family transposase [Verrucomicrobia bacterium]|nr:MAG: IS4 family transposase [Verrucomicrobiota bacterium]